MKNFCFEYRKTGRCTKKEKCTEMHRREIEEESPGCSMCALPAACKTACMHFFCWACAELGMQQVTQCVVCTKETHGIVYPLPACSVLTPSPAFF